MTTQTTTADSSTPLLHIECTGKNFKLFGCASVTDHKWFERSFSNLEAAVKYAAKKNWRTQEIVRHNGIAYHPLTGAMLPGL